MKNLFVFLCLAFFLPSCSIIRSFGPNAERMLYHSYKGVSTANKSSKFRLMKRTIEFEYEAIKKDSLGFVTIMITSGFNEGQLTDQLAIVLKNGTELDLKAYDLSFRDYVEGSSTSSSTPIHNTKTITDPGGSKTVVLADGTHQQQLVPPTTKTVTEVNQQTSTSQVSKSQIFNKGKIKLNEELIKQIKKHGIDAVRLELQDCEILVNLSNGESRQVIDHI